MDWSNVNWKEYDKIYYPKRKVNNHTSWKIHHMMGSFYSNKMETAVEYESFGELLACLLFDFDKPVLRYYVQPVKVDIPEFKENGEKTIWPHIPDVLVFRNGSNPMLYQIKDPEYDPPPNFELINERCIQYANERNWRYKVIYPKLMPKVVSTNIQLISSRSKKRNYYDSWIPEIIYRLEFEKVFSIIDLALSFKTKINPIMILPIIYYLISIGMFKVDMFQVLDQYSKVTIHNGQNEFDNFFSEEISK